MSGSSVLSTLKTWPLVLRVGDLLREAGIEGYAVGGWLRDGLVGAEVDDIDFAVAGDGLNAAARVASILGGKYVALDDVNGVGRVVLSEADGLGLGSRTLDFATLQGNILEDLARRDFTIDAMAVSLRDISNHADLKLIDPFRGQDDLADRVVRVTGESVFSADPIRLLRAVRLAGALRFTIEARTEAMIRNCAHLIGGVAGERIREELVLLLAAPSSGRLVTYSERLGLVTELFPELSATKGVVQPAEHRWDVFEHSLKTVEAVDFLLRQGTWEYAGPNAQSMAPWSPDLKQYFEQEVGHGSTREVLLKIAALFHDTGKPRTLTVEPEGRIRFLGHAREGAAIAAAILERLRFSTREARLVEAIVEHHLRPTQMGLPELPTQRAVYRYYRDTGEAGVAVLFLSLADHLATRGDTFDMSNWEKHTRTVHHILSLRPEERARPARLIDGHDIMSVFGLSPGPRVGELLGIVREAQAVGEVSSKSEALALVRKLLGARPGAGHDRDGY